MQVFTIPQTASVPTRRRAVALGAFDGVHIGHREVLRRTMDAEDAVPTVLTFRQSPLALPKQAPAVMEEADKRRLLSQLGIAELWEMDFDRVCGLSPEQFVRQILRDTLHAATVCCGESFRFGKDGAGNTETLRTLCAAEGIETVVAPTVYCDGETVSSSGIRALLRAGEIQKANRRLGASFGLTAPVTAGRQLGRKLGFPTLNQPWPPQLVMPRAGVYTSCVEIDGRVYHSVTNIGVRPTVDGNTPMAETCVLDFEGDLYGRTLTVRPVTFLREERPFASEEALRTQVLRDIETARRQFAPSGRVRAVLFDFDDTLQSRPIAFRKYTAYFVRRHFPQLSEKEQAERAEAMWEKNANGHGYVLAEPYIPYEPYFQYFKELWDWKDAPTTEELSEECYLRFSAMATPFDDAVQALRLLRSHGLAVGCITNGLPRMQNRKLDVSGLRPWLDITVVSGEEGVHKPDAEPFFRAAARLGVACEDCVYVGDHPINDLQGAVNAGMQPLYMDAFALHNAPENIPAVTSPLEAAEWVLSTEEGKDETK